MFVCRITACSATAIKENDQIKCKNSVDIFHIIIHILWWRAVVVVKSCST
jgi:hypothetical protein